MIPVYFWFDEKKEKWRRCTEETCLLKAELGHDVRKVLYKKLPKSLRTPRPTSSKKKRRGKHNNGQNQNQNRKRMHRW